MSKTAIVLFSDPKGGSEEALGRAFNALFRAVRDKVAGVCGGCAAAFGAADGARATGLPVTGELAIPGVGKVISLGDYLARGYRLVNF